MKRKNFPGRKQARRHSALMRRTRDLGRYRRLAMGQGLKAKRFIDKEKIAQADVDALRARVSQ